MKKQRGEGGGEFIFVILFLLGWWLVSIVWGRVACHSKWDHAGMSAISYGPIKGCMVQLPDGRWLPEINIREIDIPKPEKK